MLRVCALASGARGCCWRACVHACVRVCIPVALVCVRERKQMATRASHACTLVQPGPCSAPGPDVARAGALLSSRMCARFCVHAWARARVGLRVRVQVGCTRAARLHDRPGLVVQAWCALRTRAAGGLWFGWAVWGAHRLPASALPPWAVSLAMPAAPAVVPVHHPTLLSRKL